ncbi:hypothetical protein GJ688_09840 [Heliobacillus mobilis]|uniref:Lipoprotein n=1 Tax=Heliobacterium mobile TaxID=28064 RepID=A0A6I3SK55_HELMO|nr:hypothetical protein [Heliobacterium mobile]MTV49279.1 hypothetical protein [Heliobacterium mobile]
MNRTWSKSMIASAVVVGLLSLTGCSNSNSDIGSTVNNVVDKVQSASSSEIASQLSVVLQNKIEQVKTKNEKVVNSDGTINWDELGKTEFVDYPIASVFGWDYKATLQGNGTVEVMQVNQNTGEKKVFATYKVEFVDGQVAVK